jgi:hypothetical protein
VTERIPDAPAPLRTRILGAAALGVLGVGYALRLVPWRCPLAWITGHPCPACGVTRAAHLVAHGALAQATRTYPLWWLVFPAFAALAAVELGGWLVTGRFGVALRRRWVQVAALAVCAAMFVVWIARFFGAFGGPVRV